MFFPPASCKSPQTLQVASASAGLAVPRSCLARLSHLPLWKAGHKPQQDSKLPIGLARNRLPTKPLSLLNLCGGREVCTYCQVMAGLSVWPILASDALSKNIIEFSQKMGIVSPLMRRHDETHHWPGFYQALLGSILWSQC